MKFVNTKSENERYTLPYKFATNIGAYNTQSLSYTLSKYTKYNAGAFQLPEELDQITWIANYNLDLFNSLKTTNKLRFIIRHME